MKGTASRLLVMLMAACSLLACNPKAPSCRSPLDRERVFPFTGEWEEDAPPSELCLYQQDARRVLGFWDGKPVAGLVRPDGTLYLASDRSNSILLATFAKSGDSLITQGNVLADGHEVTIQPFVRRR